MGRTRPDYDAAKLWNTAPGFLGSGATDGHSTLGLVPLDQLQRPHHRRRLDAPAVVPIGLVEEPDQDQPRDHDDGDRGDHRRLREPSLLGVGEEADDGFVVIGVHTPEFSFEHEIDGVRRATKERGIDYPVAVESDYEIWSAFDNHYWPALYFVDGDGTLRDHHFGEGRYEQSERVIQRLLGVEHELVSVEGRRVEADADWEHLRTPETYLGYGRGERFASPDDAALDERRTYELPERLRLNHWALAGEWTIGRETVVLDQAGGSIAHRFHARDAHLVLSPGARGPIRFRVLLDGDAPGPSPGVDVDKDGNGLLQEGRVYQLVRERDAVRERTLEITFLAPGAEAYAFTFG
jgi:hypothetical protein